MRFIRATKCIALLVVIACNIELRDFIAHDIIEWTQENQGYPGWGDLRIVYRIWNNTANYIDTVDVYFFVYFEDYVKLTKTDYVNDITSGDIKVDSIIFDIAGRKVTDVKINRVEER